MRTLLLVLLAATLAHASETDAPPPVKEGPAQQPAGRPKEPAQPPEVRPKTSEVPAKKAALALRVGEWTYLRMPEAVAQALRGGFGREDAPETAATINGVSVRPLSEMIKTMDKVTSVSADGTTGEAVSNAEMDRICQRLIKGSERCRAEVLRLAAGEGAPPVDIRIELPGSQKIHTFKVVELPQKLKPGGGGAAGEPKAAPKRTQP